MRANIFSSVIEQLRGGQAECEMDEALAALCAACEESGKAGSMTLTLKVKPNGRSGQFVFGDDIKVKAPELAKGDTLLFQDELGNLTRSDPKQLRIDLKRVPAEIRELKTATTKE